MTVSSPGTGDGSGGLTPAVLAALDGVDPAAVAARLRAVLDALPPDSTPADAGTRAHLAAVADQLDPPT